MGRVVDEDVHMGHLVAAAVAAAPVLWRQRDVRNASQQGAYMRRTSCTKLGFLWMTAARQRDMLGSLESCAGGQYECSKAFLLMKGA